MKSIELLKRNFEDQLRNKDTSNTDRYMFEEIIKELNELERYEDIYNTLKIKYPDIAKELNENHPDDIDQMLSKTLEIGKDDKL